MSGPNPPGSDSFGQEGSQPRHARPEDPSHAGPDEQPGGASSEDQSGHGLADERPDAIDDEPTVHTDAHSRAYSAPESEQFTSGPYVPPDPALYDYDYDDYEPATELVERPSPPRWPTVVGITAILAAIALVASVWLVVTRTETHNVATPPTATTTSRPPVQDEFTTPTTPPPPPPPPTTTSETPPPSTTETTVTTSESPPPPPSPSPTPAPAPSTTATTATTAPPPPPPPTTPAGPRQVTYSVTGTKAPGDIITITYVDASGRSRTQHNVYIPWSMTVTPISQSEIGSVQAFSLLHLSRLNCAITTSDGQVLSSNNSDAAQTSC